jgi:PAS domain S-box-containing protein
MADLRHPISADELRRQAEERLAGLAVEDAATPPMPEDLTAAVHELRVHQIELEMQNEELRSAQLEADALRVKYAELFHLAPVGYFTLNEKGVVGEANLTAAGLLGVERRQLVGQPFSAFVCGADRKEYYRVLQLLQQAEEPHSCELRLQPVGGELFWAQLEGQPQGDAGDGPRRYHLTFTDVHRRVLAEEALRRREERLARALEGSGVGLWDWQVQTGEETFNERWAEMVGYTLAELAPTSVETWRSLTPPDDLQRSDELLEAHFRGESEAYECEARMRHKDGHWVWVLDRGKVTEWDADGRPLRMLGTGLDISARKQAEQRAEGRVKEVRALSSLAEMAGRPGLTLDGLYQELADLLPASWHYPQVAGARTVIGEREFCSAGFTESAWTQSAPVKVNGAAVGRIEVGYGEAMPDEDEGPFLKEERRLIDALAERLGRIIERVQAQEALGDATDRLALATRAGGVGLWDYFVTDDVLTWDDQMFALYGITREQFGGAYEAWQAGLHPDDRERGDAEIQAALRGEKEFDTEFRVLWPDGTIRSIRALALVQRDASGQATHMIGTNWDVTTQRRAQVLVQQ